MSEISDLKQRVEAVGKKFGQLAEQDRSYGERLTGLLGAVEEGFARSQKETLSLRQELETAKQEAKTRAGEAEAAKQEAETRMGEAEAAKEEAKQRTSELESLRAEQEKTASALEDAKDESKQLRGMLQTLLEAVENGGNMGLGDAMRDLETRIDQIVINTDVSPDSDPAKTSAAPSAPASAADPAAILSAAEAAIPTSEPAAAKPAEVAAGGESEIPLELSKSVQEPDDITPASAAKEAAPKAAAADPVPEDPVPEDPVPEDPVPEDPTEKAEDKPVAAESEVKAAPEFLAPPDAANEPSEEKKAEPPSDDDLSAVNKIIQRISLLTGEFVEPSGKKSDTAESKNDPVLKAVPDSKDSTKSGADKAS